MKHKVWILAKLWSLQVRDSQYLLKLTGESLRPAESESTCSAATQASFDLRAGGGGSED